MGSCKLLSTHKVCVLQASIQVEDCDQINISTSTTATTFYGIPGPVTNARVVNDSATLDCVIEWQYFDNYDPNILNYKVVFCCTFTKCTLPCICFTLTNFLQCSTSYFIGETCVLL